MKRRVVLENGVDGGERLRERSRVEKGTVARRVHVREVEDGTNPARAS